MSPTSYLTAPPRSNGLCQVRNCAQCHDYTVAYRRRQTAILLKVRWIGLLRALKRNDVFPGLGDFEGGADKTLDVRGIGLKLLMLPRKPIVLLHQPRESLIQLPLLQRQADP